MEFFVPHAKNKEDEAEIYLGIKRFISDQMKANISDRKIFKIIYQHDGNKHNAEVGKVTDSNGEEVMAILYEEGRDLYHICTLNRGVVRGISLLVGGKDTEEVIEF